MPNRHRFKKIGWHLDPTLVSRLKAYCARTGVTATSVVAAGLATELDRRETAELDQGEC